MKTFKIPVIWEMGGYINIEAETLDEAIKKFDEEWDKYPLPEDTEFYIDGSFQREDDEICELNNQ
jgi:hypothetical protein